MSYPPPRHLADTGEPSALLRRAEAPPDLLLGTRRVHDLATSATTGGDFVLFRWDTAGSGGPDPHSHRTSSESFFVLSGTVRLYDGRGWTDAGPGDFRHVPPGGIHAFAHDSGAPASMLIRFAPGAPREAYFAGLAELAARGREPTEDERLAFLRRHDQHPV